MGGAIAVKAAAANVIPSLVGLSVIDVVEGMYVGLRHCMYSHLFQKCISVMLNSHILSLF